MSPMMTQFVEESIDKAFLAEVEKLFGVLCGDLIMGDERAGKKFGDGLRMACTAHELALKAVEEMK